MSQVHRPANTKQGTVSAASSITDYEDLVIFARRKDARTVSVTVYASPAGRMAKAQETSLPLKEAEELRGRFLASFFGSGTQTGRMMLTQAEAISIGKRLAQVLFPGEVFRLFAESLSMSPASQVKKITQAGQGDTHAR